ncbi:MAG: DUF3159 domain-containing protein [Actinobacteria bacterium]|nr:DUF3159 domain-containing protein [Actinomycetota bacterium]
MQRDDAPEPEGYPEEDLGASGLEGGSGQPGDATTEQLMANAIGGWRGLLDGSLPSAVFLVGYIVSGQQLRPAVIGAVAAGLLIAVLRIVRKQSLQQVLSGFLGVAFCAWFASRTGNAEDYYLPGLLINAVYGTVLAVSCLVGHPLLGYGVGAAIGDVTGWRSVPEQRRAYALATWFFVAVFALRIVVQLPLYLAGSVAALGTARLFMGWPLFALAAFLAFRVISTARREAPVPARED